MEKLEMFKEFVKKNPSLIRYVKNNEMTWQKFYEMYDLYGEENDVWNSYLNAKIENNISKPDVMSLIKNINLDNFQEGINSVQRVLGLLGDITNNTKNESNTVKPRPIYKHFDD